MARMLILLSELAMTHFGTTRIHCALSLLETLMRLRNSPQCRFAATFGFMVAGAIVIAQAPDPIKHSSHVSLVQDLFKNAFPELAGKSLAVTVSLDSDLDLGDW